MCSSRWMGVFTTLLVAVFGLFLFLFLFLVEMLVDALSPTLADEQVGGVIAASVALRV